MLHRPLLTALMAALLAGTAAAQDVRLYRAGETVNPREVAAILDPTPEGRMRGLKLLDDASPVQLVSADPTAADAGAAAQPEAPSALALPVQFAFDSADILPAARPQLDALAEGIRLLPATAAVVIEGHTDARGSDDYNQKLSRRRAEAVRQYLVVRHGIEPARLRPLGLGEQATLPGLDPQAPENRRVQFRAG